MADVTVIGQGIFLRGSIRGDGDLEIRGRIEGEVEVGGEVTIADGALVKADVSARRITVRGAVAGNLTGEDGVRLEEGARVVGDLRGAGIGIAEGALLRGNVQTGHASDAQRSRARQPAREARPPVRVEPRKAPAPAPVAAKGNGVPRKVVAAPVEERPGPPPPVVPVLKKGSRAAVRKRSR
jgi:cytoskeletal protein CcmA (bactofilin family)